MALHSIKGFVHDTHKYSRTLHRLHKIASPHQRGRRSDHSMGLNEVVFTLPDIDIWAWFDKFWEWLENLFDRLTKPRKLAASSENS